MRRESFFRRWWVVAATLVSLLAISVLTGCSTSDDAENLSERPWNAPKSWEGGMPSGMFEGR